MSNWTFDPVATKLSGTLQHRMPYPQDNWRDERLWNGFLIEAMELVHEAYSVFSKHVDKWEKKENEFYKWMLEELKELEKNDDL